MGKDIILSEEKDLFGKAFDEIIPELRDRIYRTSHGIA